VGPYTFRPSSKYGCKLEQYRALQRSENFATSTTEEKVATHDSSTASRLLSATNAVTVKALAKIKTKLDEKNVLVDLVQSLDTQEEIKPDADEWKVFFSNQSNRVKAPADVGKLTSRNTSPKLSPGGKTGARKSEIPPPRAIGVTKRKNDQIRPAQQDKIPGQVHEKKERVESSQKPRAERTSDMGRKTPKQKSQSTSSPDAVQTCCNRCQHQHSGKQTVKRRWLPLPRNVTSLRLYGPAFFRMNRQNTKRDASKKAKYQPKLATIPEEPEEIDPKWNEPLKLVQEYEEYCKGALARIAETSARYEELKAEEVQTHTKLVAESENSEFMT